MSRRAFVARLSASAAVLALGSLARPSASASAAPLADDILTPTARPPGQLSSLITPTAAFYKVTKNPLGGDPAIEAGSWRLIIDGQVNSPVQMDYAILQQLPLVEVVKTLECISNLTSQCELAAFGCDLISTAVWQGARLGDVFDLAGGFRPNVTGVAAISADEFSSVIPASAALDPETLLVYLMNGAPLPAAHGFPARLLIPGRYGMKSAKWVVQLTALDRQVADWYGQRGWSQSGIVKTMSRIDTPANLTELPPGVQIIAGIAYGGDRGISAVEFSADGGASWQPAAFLEAQPGRDAWVRWQGSFNLGSGEILDLVCRAYDGTGALQIQQFTLPQPDGGAGLHSVKIKGA